MAKSIKVNPNILECNDFTIDKLKQGDGTTVNILTSKIHGTQIKFASRSLAWPAGYDV